MTHHLWLICALLVLRSLKEQERLSHLHRTSFEEPHGLLSRRVANRAAGDIEATKDRIGSPHHSNMPLEEEIELLERIARLQMRAESLIEDRAQEDCDDEDEDDCLLGGGESEVVIFA